MHVLNIWQLSEVCACYCFWCLPHLHAVLHRLHHWGRRRHADAKSETSHRHHTHLLIINAFGTFVQNWLCNTCWLKAQYCNTWSLDWPPFPAVLLQCAASLFAFTVFYSAHSSSVYIYALIWHNTYSTVSPALHCVHFEVVLYKYAWILRCLLNRLFSVFSVLENSIGLKFKV